MFESIKGGEVICIKFEWFELIIILEQEEYPFTESSYTFQINKLPIDGDKETFVIRIIEHGEEF